MVARSILAKHPGATILHNLICSKTVPEVIAEGGGTAVRTRVGHSFIKQVMAETGALFGGEHSGHYYFADNFRADSGLIAALVILEALSNHDSGLADLVSSLDRYAASGEINTTVDDAAAVIDHVADVYSAGDRTAWTVSRSTWVTGGSTCVRAIPSRSCGSTSRPPTTTRLPGASTRFEPTSQAEPHQRGRHAVNWCP